MTPDPRRPIPDTGYDQPMSAINGDKSRHSINRKRGIQRRAKVRALLQAGVAKPSIAPAATPASKTKPAAR
jgi:hypothetical protein